MVKLIPFHERYNDQIIDLILDIQRREFGLNITVNDQPDLSSIAATYQSNNGNFWVAVESDEVVGTIGLIDAGDRLGVVRKMFVSKLFRGATHGVAHQLLSTLTRWATARHFTALYLGTVPQMAAAHRFYEKNGFVSLPEDQLPASFPRMRIDTRFYRRDLMSPSA